jgi:hypothetical protein
MDINWQEDISFIGNVSSCGLMEITFIAHQKKECIKKWRGKWSVQSIRGKSTRGKVVPNCVTPSALHNSQRPLTTEESDGKLREVLHSVLPFIFLQLGLVKGSEGEEGQCLLGQTQVQRVSRKSPPVYHLIRHRPACRSRLTKYEIIQKENKY